MKDIAVDKKSPRQVYTPAQVRMVRYLYETEGLANKEISARTAIHRNVIGRWVKKYNWKQGRHIAIIEQTELQARLEKAAQLGIGEVEQITKAKELMDATQFQQMMELGEDGKSRMVSVPVPDYKIQNEGLKRAMELTGTKIERKEIEHKGSQEIVHKYEMPAKITPE